MFAINAPVNFHGQDVLLDTLVHLENLTVHYSQEFLQPLEVWYKVKCPLNSTTTSDCKRERRRWHSPKDIKTSTDDHYSRVWNRGHMAPVESFDCSCDDVASVMTRLNCAMQDASLNQHGPWRELERRELELAKTSDVFVYILIKFDEEAKNNGARIPTGFIKILQSDSISESYYFPNQKPESKELSDYLTSFRSW